MSVPYAERLARLRASLAQSQLDALLVSALPNVRYLTGFTGSNGLVLVTADDAVLLDNSDLDIEQSVQTVLNWWHGKQAFPVR